MIKVIWNPSFKKAYKKKIHKLPHMKRKLFLALYKFQENPFEQSLNTHKLSGYLQNCWSFKVDYDYRVIFEFEGKDKAILVDIGTHDQVY